MYNRYVGNTGKFYRVDEPGDQRPAGPSISPNTGRSPVYNPASLLTAQSGSLLPHGLTEGLKGMLKGFLPAKMEVGDLLLILVLLLLYLEKEDEEILIILAALIFFGFD
jgi:hypothetical protein